MRTMGMIALAAGVSMAGLTMPAFAQEKSGTYPESPTSQTASASSENEIIVTAQRRAERLVDVPQSVTVVSQDDIEALAAVQLRDYFNTVPGLNVTGVGVGQNSISMRGISSTTSPTVGIYVDEVPYGSSTTYTGPALGLDIAMFDIERVEVLRGPQGTLYGASSMGGLLKYVTVAPSPDQFSGQVKAGISTTRFGGENYNGSAVANIPIASGAAAARISGFYARDGGYVDNIQTGERNVGRSNVYGGRADLLFNLRDNFSVRVVAFAQDIHRNGTGTSDFTLAGVPIVNALVQRRPRPESFDQQLRLASGTLEYDAGPVKLTSISAYQSVKSNLNADLTALYNGIASIAALGFSGVVNDNDLNVEKFTQEIRLASASEGTFSWTVGGFYTDERSDSNSVLRTYNAAGGEVVSNIFNSLRPSSYSEYALFATGTLSATNRLDISAGLRASWNEVNTRRIGSSTINLVGPQAPTSSKEDVVTYLANARYRFSDRTVAYFRFATGYRPGGPNFVTLNPTTGLPVGPEMFESDKLESYELGFRTSTADDTLSVDLAAYHINWTDIQQQVTLVTSAGVFSGIVNAPGGAKVDGIEATLRAQPTKGLIFTAALAYQDARLSEAYAPIGGAKGERLPNTPKYTAIFAGDYRFDVGSGKLGLGATLRFVDDRTNGFRGRPTSFYRLPSYEAVDLRASYEFDAISVQLYIRNLFDARGQLAANVGSAPGVSRVSIQQPRTIGISLSGKF